MSILMSKLSLVAKAMCGKSKVFFAVRRGLSAFKGGSVS